MARKKAKALPPKMITVYAEILQETELAILVRCDEDADGVWLPKSQIKYEGERGDTGVEIEIPELMADEKGFYDGMGKSEATPIGEAIGSVVDGLKPQQPENVTLPGRVVGITEDDITIAFLDLEDNEIEVTTLLEEVSFEGQLSPGDMADFTIPFDLAVDEGLVEEPDETPAGKRAFGDNVKWLKEERITVSTPLTETERAKYADDMSALDMEIGALKDARAEVSNRLKKIIDAKDEERLAMSKIVAEGELRETLCDCLKDYNTGEMVWTEAYPPYAEVQRRKMTKEEMQPSLLEYSEKMAASAPVEDADLDADDASYSPLDDDANGPLEKACNACAHLDFAADNNVCDGCGDDLSNFTPLAAAEPQGQDSSAGGVQ